MSFFTSVNAPKKDDNGQPVEHVDMRDVEDKIIEEAFEDAISFTQPLDVGPIEKHIPKHPLSTLLDHHNETIAKSAKNPLTSPLPVPQLPASLPWDSTPPTSAPSASLPLPSNKPEKRLDRARLSAALKKAAAKRAAAKRAAADIKLKTALGSNPEDPYEVPSSSEDDEDDEDNDTGSCESAPPSSHKSPSLPARKSPSPARGSLPPHSGKLRSVRKLRGTQSAEKAIQNPQPAQNAPLDTDTNERLPIQVPLPNKWYTPKPGAWESMKEGRQRVLTHIQNIEGSSGELRDPPCDLCKKRGYECRVYKQNSGPHFGGACSRCRLGGRLCENSSPKSKPVTPRGKKRAKSASADIPAETPTKKPRTRTPARATTPSPPNQDLPSPKTPTRTSMRSRGGTRSAAAPPNLSPIPSTPAAAPAAPSASNSTGGGMVYSALAVSARVDLVRARVNDIANDIRVIDRRLDDLEETWNGIKDELAFMRRGIIALVRHAGLQDIEFE